MVCNRNKNLRDKEIAKEIIKRWNNKQKEDAIRYFSLRRWMMSNKVISFFESKFEEHANSFGILKEACDLLGGKIYDENNNIIYANKASKKNKTREKDSKGDNGVAMGEQVSFLEKSKYRSF